MLRHSEVQLSNYHITQKLVTQAHLEYDTLPPRVSPINHRLSCITKFKNYLVTIPQGWDLHWKPKRNAEVTMKSTPVYMRSL